MSESRAPEPGSPATEGPWAGPQTASIWFMAFSPLWFSALAVGAVVALVTFVPGIDPAILLVDPIRVALPVLGAALYLLMSFGDVNKLRQHGYERTPGRFWVIPLPLVYFIVRRVKIGKGATGPLVTFILVNLVTIAGFVALALLSATMPLGLIPN